MAKKSLEGVVVAVTGATGMLGRELVERLLDAGAKLRLVVRDCAKVPDAFRDAGAEVVECSLTNPRELAEAFRGVDTVFNCAAMVSFRLDDGTDIVRCNTDIARHVVNACIETGADKLVHVSSIAALSGTPANGSKFIDESCYPDNVSGWNGYSASKYFSENEVWRGYKSGLRTVIVNPSVILGEGDWSGEGSAALFGVAAKGMPFYTEGVTGYVDVKDVARAMVVLSLEEGAVGRRFILSAENLSYRDFIGAVARSVGRKPPRIKAGRRVLGLFRVAESLYSKITGREPKLTRQLIKTSLAKSFYDSGAFLTLTGFEFTPIRDTLSRMAVRYLKDRR